MRLDKYLKVSRLIKRRTVAKEISDQGRISINGKVAKSSSDVSTNDELEICFGNKTLTVKVLKIVETTKKDEAADMYEVVSETFAQDFRTDSDGANA
ncbi:RNA-binding S4 domain-containing protein [Leuconostoc lactis]|uniref:RNA-binding S4 domain-containing protein n=1 Tax=Leuconostoc lactis TaxID=1246 RepID=UPI0021A33880|nr:RNA-binding S4 domain-containing protein [Leuconostoc lactis]MCT3115722.1 RNA-binding S4 domain-containing protein [Leuconostoc lactis]